MRKRSPVAEASGTRSRSPSSRLWAGLKLAQLRSVSSPERGVMFRYPTIRPPSVLEAVTVPGSVFVRRQPGGYASEASPEGSRRVLQPGGTGCGRSQANAAGSAGAVGPAVSEEPHAASAAALASASAATRDRRRGLDVAVAVAGSAVVVRIVVPAVVLGDAVVVVMMMVVVSRERHSGPADREGQRGDERHERLACSAQHRVVPSASVDLRNTVQAPAGMGLTA